MQGDRDRIVEEEETYSIGEQGSFRQDADGQLSFLLGVCYIPHRKNINLGGEDASFLQPRVIGVFDGVGSWKLKGIDAGLYSKECARLASRYVSLHNGASKRTLQDALNRNTLIGSTTACIAEVVGQNVLRGFNIGDSGLIVIRAGKRVYKTQASEHAFNTPYSLCRNENGEVVFERAKGYDIRFTLELDDFLVMASDGLWDNIFENDILQMVRATQKHPRFENKVATLPFNFSEYHGNDTRSVMVSSKSTGGTYPHAVAKELAERAEMASRRKTGQSPFQRRAQQVGKLYRGGKEDDVMVVCAIVIREKNRAIGPNSSSG